MAQSPPLNDPLTLAAELLIRKGEPGEGERLMRRHSPDSSGHCVGCSHSITAAPIHPCRLWLIGEKITDLEREARDRGHST